MRTHAEDQASLRGLVRDQSKRQRGSTSDRSGREGGFISLQRRIGNRAVGRVIRAMRTINAPGTENGRGSDRAANPVVRRGLQAPSRGSQGNVGTQPEQNSLQVKEKGPTRSAHQYGTSSTLPGPVGETLNSPGRPIEPATRDDMESRFGEDFSSVRIHRGSSAARSAAALDAAAYTVGNDVVFGHRNYNPATPRGLRLLAHELAHVVQQRRGGTEAPGETHEREAETASLSTIHHPGFMRVVGRARVGVARQPTHLEKGHVGEQLAGFGEFPAKQGWVVIRGPSGAAGHPTNAPGEDTLAYNTRTKLLVIQDNKSYSSSKNVAKGKASAIEADRNLEQNLDDMISAVESLTDFDHKKDVLKKLRKTRAVVRKYRQLPAATRRRTNLRLPGKVQLVITNYAGESGGVSAGLRRMGVTIWDKSSPTQAHPPRVPATVAEEIASAESKVLSMKSTRRRPSPRLELEDLVPSLGSLVKGFLIDIAVEFAIQITAHEIGKRLEMPKFVRHIHQTLAERLLKAKQSVIEKDIKSLVQEYAKIIIERQLRKQPSYAVIRYIIIETPENPLAKYMSGYLDAQYSRTPLHDVNVDESEWLKDIVDPKGPWTKYTYTFSVPLEFSDDQVERYVINRINEMTKSGVPKGYALPDIPPSILESYLIGQIEKRRKQREEETDPYEGGDDSERLKSLEQALAALDPHLAHEKKVMKHREKVRADKAWRKWKKEQEQIAALKKIKPEKEPAKPPAITPSMKPETPAIETILPGFKETSLHKERAMAQQLANQFAALRAAKPQLDRMDRDSKEFRKLYPAYVSLRKWWPQRAAYFLKHAKIAGPRNRVAALLDEYQQLASSNWFLFSGE